MPGPNDLPSDALDSEYPLTGARVKEYQQNGFILLPQLASTAELKKYRPLMQRMVQRKFEEQDKQGRKEGYGQFFTQVTNVWRLDDTLREFIFAKRFARVAAALMGVRGVRLYHDQALFKPGGGKPTPWHQDQFYWPLDTMHTITLWMPLVDAPRTMGTMLFASGSHRNGPLLDLSISEEADRRFESLVEERGFPVVDYALKAGDATFHSGWTVHAAHANSSGQTREVITIIYYADGTRIMEPDSEYRKVDMEVFHPGQKPGELAASPLNPLLFP